MATPSSFCLRQAIGTAIAVRPPIKIPAATTGRRQCHPEIRAPMTCTLPMMHFTSTRTAGRIVSPFGVSKNKKGWRILYLICLFDFFMGKGVSLCEVTHPHLINNPS